VYEYECMSVSICPRRCVCVPMYKRICEVCMYITMYVCMCVWFRCKSTGVATQTGLTELTN